MRGKWTDEDELYLKKMYPTTPTEQLAKDLNRSEVGIRSRAKVLGLKKEFRTKLSPEEIRILSEKYPRTRNIDLAKEFGVSKQYIGQLAFNLGLKTDPDFKLACSAKAQFKKGHEPMNKGLKQSEYMSPEKIARTKASRFKKGETPVNKVPVGTKKRRRDSSGNYYWHIKVSDRKVKYTIENWEFLHRHIWEQHNGPIPEGYMVTFKDGDRENCTVENLEMIDLSENLNRNFHHYPQEYKKAVRKLTHFKKRIQKLAKDGKK